MCIRDRYQAALDQEKYEANQKAIKDAERDSNINRTDAEKRKTALERRNKLKAEQDALRKAALASQAEADAWKAADTDTARKTTVEPDTTRTDAPTDDNSAGRKKPIRVTPFDGERSSADTDKPRPTPDRTPGDVDGPSNDRRRIELDTTTGQYKWVDYEDDTALDTDKGEPEPEKKAGDGDKDLTTKTGTPDTKPGSASPEVGTSTDDVDAKADTEAVDEVERKRQEKALEQELEKKQEK